MIRYADDDRTRGDLERVLAGDDLLHGCILSTRYRALGVAAGARFWVCYDGADRPCAALLGQPDCFLVCDGGIARPDASGAIEELGEFLRFSGCGCLVGRRKLLERVRGIAGLPEPYGAPAMVWDGGACARDAEIVRVAEGFRPVYDLIVGNYGGFDNYGGGGGYDDWLAGLRLREWDGLCSLFALYEDGVPVATGAVSGASARAVDIGGIVTRADRRGRGYAGRMVRHLVAAARERGRTAVLGCARGVPELARFYERLGFRRYDDWAVSETAENA